MRVYVSVDMEGVAGVATAEQVLRGCDDYPAARKLMTLEAGAAVAGAFDGGATEVVVNDAHGDMGNLLPELLDERATLVLGSPKVSGGMMQALDPEYDAALFVGYHAGPGVQDAVLAHTFTSAFLDLRLDGNTATEAELNALLAGSFGVPVALVTGDRSICAIVAERLPGTRTLAVKHGEGHTAAHSMHPTKARGAIREAAGAAVAGAGRIAPLRPSPPHRFEAELSHPRQAELCALVPGAERHGRTVSFGTDDYVEGYQCVRAWMYLCRAADSLRRSP